MFYVNTDTKLFTAAPWSNSYIASFGCGCADQDDKPLFLSTHQRGPSSCKKIDKPVLFNYSTNVLQFTFLDNDGLPYDLTDCTLALAVDSTFSHSDSLVALADGDVLSPLDGVVEFKVSRFSRKFAQLLKQGVPSSQIWMQITAYTKDGEQNILLQDRGIKLATKLLLNEGLTQDNLLNFYNKQQIDAFLIGIGRPDLIPDKGLVVAGATPYSDSRFRSGDLYVDYSNKDLYLNISDSVLYLGNLDMGGYYTKEEMDAIASALSNSIASVKSSLSDYYTKEQTNQLLDTKASNSYVQSIDLQVQDLKQLHIVQLNTPQQGFAATYQLQDHQGNPLGASINIFKDKFLGDADLIVASQQDHEADPSVIIGDPYLKLVFNTQPATTIYVSVKDLVDTYNAGQGLKLQNSTFSIESDQQEDSIKFLQIGTATIGLKGITTAVNKVLSDANTYTDTELQDYYTKSQINVIAGSLSNSITALKQELHGSYYTRTQVDALIAGLSNSTDLSNYYTKSQVDGIAASLSNSIQTVKGTFDNYYNKEQIDQLFQQFSDSVDLSNYYTKGQVDVLVQALSNSIAVVRTSLSNYYTKTEVQQIASQLSDSIQAVRGTFGNYYTKEQVEQLLSQLSNSVDLSNYYTKAQTDAIAGALSDSLQSVKSALSGYYTKDQADAKLSALSDSLAAVNGKFSDYYNRGQVDSFVASLSNSIGNIKTSVQNLQSAIEDLSDAVDTRFGNYYTKSQVDGIAKGLSNSFDVKLQGYYNKGQLDAKIGQLSDSIQDINAQFSDYYTKSQIDQLIGQLSDSIDLSAYYTKTQIDNLLAAQIVQQGNISFAPQDNTIYKHILQQSDSIVLDTSAFTSSRQVTFELHLTQPSTAATFTWPANIVWGDSTYFGSANPAPDMSTADTEYCIVIRWDGSDLLANLAYTKAIEVNA